MYKKLILTQIFLLILFIAPAAAQTFYFAGDTEVNVGNSLSVSLYVNTSTSLGSIQLDILFDPSVIQAEDVVFSVSNALSEKTIDNQTGKVTIGVISVDGVTSGKIAELTFRGVSTGTSPLNISIVDLTDTANNPLIGSAVNTTIQVLSTTEPTPEPTPTTNYTLVLPQVALQINQSKIIPVLFSAQTNITGVNFTLLYNGSVIRITDVQPALPSMLTTKIDNTNGTASFALVFNNSISGDNIILNLTVKAISLGITYLNITDAEASDENFNVTPVNVFNGSVTVISIKGDFNGNGQVDIGDVAYVAYMVVGKIEPDLKADFNGNGRVDIGDLAKIAYYVLGKINEL